MDRLLCWCFFVFAFEGMGAFVKGYYQGTAVDGFLVVPIAANGALLAGRTEDITVLQNYCFSLPCTFFLSFRSIVLVREFVVVVIW